ncbi:MAG TPA: GIY-YIG nuclease family protein [Candidatus Saccharimonadales bacterium]|nr:GIY-YIG nuclease family protein [Candidatus Saccharimonadales bacterium]
MNYIVYILRNSANRLYIGYSKNLPQRLKDHATGVHGAKFIQDYRELSLVYTETYLTQLEAMRREKQLKGWTRAKKEALIIQDLVLLKQL